MVGSLNGVLMPSINDPSHLRGHSAISRIPGRPLKKLFTFATNEGGHHLYWLRQS